MTAVASPEATSAPAAPSASARPPDDGRRRVERRVGLPNRRALLGGLLMAVAALGAYWLATSGTADRGADVIVADRNLRAGDIVTAEDVRLVSVDIDGEVGGLFGSVAAVEGRIVTSPVDAGEFLLASATSENVDDRADTFELSVGLAPEHVPGNLAPGEAVDVFSTWNSGVTEMVAVDVVVVDVSRSDSGLIDAGNLRLRLQVADVAQTEAIVHAHNAGELTLVRSPAGSQADVGRQYRPGESTGPAADPGAEESDDD